MFPLQYSICSVNTHAVSDYYMVTLARNNCPGLNDLSQSGVVGEHNGRQREGSIKCYHLHYPWNFFAWFQYSTTAIILLSVKCLWRYSLCNFRVVGIGTFFILLVMMGLNYSSERNKKGGIYRRFIQKYMDLWKRAVP